MQSCWGRTVWQSFDCPTTVGSYGQFCLVGFSRYLSFIELQLTQRTMYPFNVCNSAGFSIFIALCIHHHSWIPEHFHHRGRKPHIHYAVTLCFSWQPSFYFLSRRIFLLWAFHIDGITQYVAFCAWLISLTMSLNSFVLQCILPFHFFSCIPLCGYTKFCLFIQ